MTKPKPRPVPLGETPRLSRCPSCGSHILEALDSPVAAIHVRLDPTPVDLATELAANLQGRHAYTLHAPASGRAWIRQRDKFTIPSTKKAPVLLTHECGAPQNANGAMPKTPAPKTKDEVSF